MSTKQGQSRSCSPCARAAAKRHSGDGNAAKTSGRVSFSLRQGALADVDSHDAINALDLFGCVRNSLKHLAMLSATHSSFDLLLSHSSKNFRSHVIWTMTGKRWEQWVVTVCRRLLDLACLVRPLEGNIWRGARQESLSGGKPDLGSRSRRGELDQGPVKRNSSWQVSWC